MKKKKKGGVLRIIVIGLIVVLMAGGAGAYMIVVRESSKDGQGNTITEAMLKEVIEISELSTVEFTYNAVAKAYLDKEKTKLKYHVAYEGLVKAGIDFTDIGISVDEEQKIIDITIPEVKIQEYNVNEGTLEYIYEADKYNDLTASAEAYKICKKDLEERAGKERRLLVLAKENAISAVKGLIEPWIEQIDNKYTIEVN